MNLTRKRNTDFSAEKKKREKTQNKWRLNRPPGQERSLAKREMALAEVRQRELAKKLFPFRPQVLRRIFTAHRRIAWTRNRACSDQCGSRPARQSRHASRRVMSSTFTCRRTGRSTIFSQLSGMHGKQSI